MSETRYTRFRVYAVAFLEFANVAAVGTRLCAIYRGYGLIRSWNIWRIITDPCRASVDTLAIVNTRGDRCISLLDRNCAR
jgi:hypothetical protein